MLSMNYRGPQRVRIDRKPMPEILHPQDAIVRVTRTCICGSDLHLYNGSVPDTRVGMTFGHEFTGVVEQVGGIRRGDTVVVFGAGPVGIMAARCAWLFGAGRVIVIDCLEYRLEFARRYAYCEAYNFK